jgi:hypothetical protein
MNQQQLGAIKARALAAHADNGPVNLEKVKAVALFRQHAVYDVMSLIAEVERLRAEVERLTPKPRRQLTPEEIRERIDDNFFDEEYD